MAHLYPSSSSGSTNILNERINSSGSDRVPACDSAHADVLMGKVNCQERWATARSGCRAEQSWESDAAFPESNDTDCVLRAADVIGTVMQMEAAGRVGALGGKALLNCGLLDTGNRNGRRGYKALASCPGQDMESVLGCTGIKRNLP